MKEVKKFLNKNDVDFDDSADEATLLELAIANGYKVPETAQGIALDTTIKGRMRVGFQITDDFKGLQIVATDKLTCQKDGSNFGKAIATFVPIESDGKRKLGFQMFTENYVGICEHYKINPFNNDGTVKSTNRWNGSKNGLVPKV